LSDRIALLKATPLSKKFVFHNSNHMEMALSFADVEGSQVEFFTNTVRNVEEGVHAEDMNKALFDSLKPFMKEKKAKKTKDSDDEDDEEEDKKPAKKSLAEKYAEMELAPLNKTALREQLELYANKLERSESEDKRAEYKYILKGMEICAGLKG
jgi:hypothetical protein